MAAISTFNGIGGPILSLTSEQHTEHTPFLGDNAYTQSVPLLVHNLQKPLLPRSLMSMGHVITLPYP